MACDPEYLTYEDNPEKIIEQEEDDIYSGFGETEYFDEKEEDLNDEDDFYERDVVTGRKQKYNPLNFTKLTKNELDNILLE